MLVGCSAAAMCRLSVETGVVAGQSDGLSPSSHDDGAAVLLLLLQLPFTFSSLTFYSDHSSDSTLAVTCLLLCISRLRATSHSPVDSDGWAARPSCTKVDSSLLPPSAAKGG